MNAQQSLATELPILVVTRSGRGLLRFSLGIGVEPGALYRFALSEFSLRHRPFLDL